MDKVQKTYLLKPRVEEDSRHEKHPPAGHNHSASKLSTQGQRIPRTQYPVFNGISESFSLDSSTLNCPVVHDHIALIADGDRARGALSPVIEIYPANLLDQEVAPQHKQEHVATNIVTSTPLASCRSTCGIRKDILFARCALHDLGVRNLTFSACKSETSVDDGRAKAPLRDEHPPGRRQAPAYQASRPPGCAGRGRVREEEDEKGECDPSPALLDEEDVENVALASKVGRRKSWVLRVGLGPVVVGRITYGGREKGEECAKGEDNRVGEQ